VTPGIENRQERRRMGTAETAKGAQDCGEVTIGITQTKKQRGHERQIRCAGEKKKLQRRTQEAKERFKQQPPFQRGVLAKRKRGNGKKKKVGE